MEEIPCNLVPHILIYRDETGRKAYQKMHINPDLLADRPAAVKYVVSVMNAAAKFIGANNPKFVGLYKIDGDKLGAEVETDMPRNDNGS